MLFLSIPICRKPLVLPQRNHKWSRNGVEYTTRNRKALENKGDLRIYEIRNRWLNACFISQYSYINLNKTHISELFRYINPCIYIYFHGELVRNWCGVWESTIRETGFITTDYSIKSVRRLTP